MDSVTSSRDQLAFFVRVTERTILNLLSTDSRLFQNSFTVEVVQKIQLNPTLSERLDAFVSRFGRLQDTVGDKLLPALLISMAEKTGAAIDNLDRAEKLGFIESADSWMEMRRLRNQMVHEYIEDLAILASALRSGHAFVPSLVKSARLCVERAHRLIT
jgi:hypothetical protein